MITMPIVQALSRYAEENYCPHCHSGESIDVIDVCMSDSESWTLGNMVHAPGDEICHCNKCGGTFIQHYERTFVGQTRSGEFRSEPMPDDLVDVAADTIETFKHLFEEIEDDPIEEFGVCDLAVHEARKVIIESKAYRWAKEGLAKWQKAYDGR